MSNLIKIRILVVALALTALTCQTKKHPFDNPLDPEGDVFQGYSAPVLSTNAPSGAPPDGEYEVYWNDVAASSYLLEEADDSTFTNTSPITVSVESKNFTHTSEGKTYYYRVKTNTGNKDSGWSNTVAVTIIKGTKISGIQFVTIPSGAFSMGDLQGVGYSDELPVHDVTLSSFEMSIYEITQGQYKSVMGTNPANSYGVGDTYPVYYVSWYDAMEFCNKLSDTEGLERCYNESTWACDFGKNGYRLPTEAEWEYACRAGTETMFYTGNTLSSD